MKYLYNLKYLSNWAIEHRDKINALRAPEPTETSESLNLGQGATIGGLGNNRGLSRYLVRGPRWGLQSGRTDVGDGSTSSADEGRIGTVRCAA